MATGVSERSFFFAALRADQNRIVRCAVDNDGTVTLTLQSEFAAIQA